MRFHNCTIKSSRGLTLPPGSSYYDCRFEVGGTGALTLTDHVTLVRCHITCTDLQRVPEQDPKPWATWETGLPHMV